MALILKKTKIPLIPKEVFESPLPAEIVSLVDSVAEGIAEYEAKVAQIKKLQSEIKPHAEKVKALAELATGYALGLGKGPLDEFSEETEQYTVFFGKAGMTRSIKSIEALMKTLGKAVFFQKATVPLGVVDQYLTPDQKNVVLDTSYGTRSVKLIRRS